MALNLRQKQTGTLSLSLWIFFLLALDFFFFFFFQIWETKLKFQQLIESPFRLWNISLYPPNFIHKFYVFG